MQTVSLLFEKKIRIKKNIINLMSAEFSQRVVQVNVQIAIFAALHNL